MDVAPEVGLESISSVSFCFARGTTGQASNSLGRFSDFPKQRLQFGLIQRHRSEARFSARVFSCRERPAQPEAALFQVAQLTRVARQAKGNHGISGELFSDRQQRIKRGLQTTGGDLACHRKNCILCNVRGRSFEIQCLLPRLCEMGLREATMSEREKLQ